MGKMDSGLQRHVHAYLSSLAADMKSEAERLVSVRTGYLKSTIYAKVHDWVAELGAEASYALFVEFGTRHMLENVITQAIEAAKAEAWL
jgi:hypothetical protein